MLVEQILKPIDDDKAINDHKPGHFPVDTLLVEYMKVAKHIAALPNLEPTNTGRELKNAIRLMDPEDQVRLLYLFLYASGEIKDQAQQDFVEEQEEHKLKLWLVKGIFFTGVVLVLILAGAIAAIAVRDGHTDNQALDGLFRMAKEIIKVLIDGN